MQNSHTLQRRRYLAASFFIVCILSFAIYIQQHDSLNPCPLCIFERIIMGALGVSFFLGAIISLNKLGRIFIGCLSLFFSVSGIIFSARHVWIQHFSPGQSDCSMGLLYLIKIMPIHEVIMKVFEGGVECAKIDWTFLTLSLPAWALICFSGFFLLSLFQLSRAA